MNVEKFSAFNPTTLWFGLHAIWLIVMLMIWTIAWKGVALWKAAREGKSGWFVAMLIINTVGILEILYIFVFSKKSKKVE